jgi:16S rRNA (adenine(1408)-N(1))-methyltransferase
VLHEARARPEAFVLGVDAVAGAMAEASRRAAAKTARGGVANAMFLCAAAESMPGALAGTADEICVNYPWGSLLRAVALPDVTMLAKLAALGKPGASFTAVINVQPLRDEAQAERLGLGDAALLHDPAEQAAAYVRAGLERLQVSDVMGEAPVATSWAKHLAVSKREVWRVEARSADLRATSSLR